MYDAWMIIGEMAVNATGQNLREQLLGNNPDGTGQGWLDIDTVIEFQPICSDPPSVAHTFSPRISEDDSKSAHESLREKIQGIFPIPIGLEALGQLYFGWGNPVAAFPPGANTGYTTADVRSAFSRLSSVVLPFVKNVSFDHTTMQGRDNLALLCCLMMDSNFRSRNHNAPVPGFFQSAPWAIPLVKDQAFLNESSVAFSSWGSKLCFMKHDAYDSLEPPARTSHVSIP